MVALDCTRDVRFQSGSRSCMVLRSRREEWSHLAVTGTEAQRACHVTTSLVGGRTGPGVLFWVPY